MIAATVASAALAAALLWVARAVSVGFASIREALDANGRAMDAEWVAGVEGRLAVLDDLVDRLPAKWQDMEEKVRASEDRTRSRIKRAVASIEGGDQTGWDRLAREADSAGLFDGERGEAAPVQPVRGDVEAAVPEIAEAGEEEWLEFARNAKWGGR